MCCLKNEEETYEYLNSRLPAIGETVTTLDGRKGEVSSVSVLRQKVKVLFDSEDEKEIEEFDVKELKFKPRRHKEKGGKNEKGAKNEKGGKREKGGKDHRKKEEAIDKELEALEALDKKEGKSKLNDD
jgi:cell fate regulator YaaT (PSP1 superfamily)